ncbi:reprolysin-like metallopeptidase [Chryseobacterium caseinilyticum]|uniref:T9SS type A sorting domain-containing protein n=1 Tax=Chryseobacterium caseinilyticum TaxID=2771428 RepID=A0ABR8ZFF6_9FLAO|nr:zinc-dependent metalloprotease family protein [Chryseobacterium caseinilyticum]MBD8083819.1 T9SS type A sorting domain-containing protein [Chryseobacterium caseinilyticum]
MKKLITALFLSAVSGVAYSQWSPAAGASKRSSKAEVAEIGGQYRLDLPQLQAKLKNAQEMGANAKPVEISVPTVNGKIERFAVYSFPVVVKELADQYQLGSYTGVGLDDPSKNIRFSLAPNDFQSMIISGDQYEFVDAYGPDKTLYTVHLKTKKTGDKAFVCSTDEGQAAVQQIKEMSKAGSSFTNQLSDYSKMSDKKYRTMRLAMSVTGEYTAFHGGTIAGALTAINATLTRVNFVFEKDFALHLNLQNYTNVIFTDPNSDPYSIPSVGTANTNSNNANGWNIQLQQTLSVNVGNANYDIGHLFGDSGGGGNAGCIGCVCINPTGTPATSLSKQKGSGFTSPANAIPQGDLFDIDYVAHEIGHQLGANHTFSMSIEGTGVNVEPGSGSTIMGYAGITGGPATDVQLNSDAYFHKVSISQVQANLISKTCDVEATVANDAPVIAALPTYTIPKGTAFVLTASATDAQNDPLTYTWEQVNSGTTSTETTNSSNLGTNTYGAAFRSLTPTASPTRYFPKLSSVLNGVLDNSNNGWESVPMVARSMKFAVTVRDNHPISTQQQTQFAEQTINAGDDGPFIINTQFADTAAPTNVTWNVVNTTAAPYNVANVKIDYTTDPTGATWVTLLASTPNDGNENITFPASLNGQTVKLRISAIGNVFYAVKSVQVAAFAPCTSAAPTGITVSAITTSGATVTWSPFVNATYVIRYRIVGSSTWQQTTSTVATVNLTGLNDGANYEVQVAAVCSGVTGTYSPSTNFTTSQIPYCAAASTTFTSNYISNLTLALVNNTTTGSTYSNFTTNAALQVALAPNSSNNSISVSLTKTATATSLNGMAVWIDFNRNGIFEASERVLNLPATLLAVGTTPVTGTFAVPASAQLNAPLRLRIVNVLLTPESIGASIPESFACGTFPSGEVEDYNVIVDTNLGTRETALTQNNIQVYPNPATEVLNITKVSEKAKFEIYSAVGQLVKSGNIANNQVRVAELVKGTYLITIKDKDITETVKFIKK